MNPRKNVQKKETEKGKKKGWRVIALLCGLLIIFSAAACGPANHPDPSGTKDNNTKPSGNVSAEDLLKDVRLALPGTKLNQVYYDDIPSAFRDALWGFADKTSRLALGSEQDKNALYSPVSFYYPLAMLEAGANGKTREGIRNLLGFTGEDHFDHLQKLYALMSYENENLGIEQIANSIWVKEALKPAIKQEWLKLLEEKLYASAFAVNFGDPVTAKRMNAWVKEGTRGKIDAGFDSDTLDPGLALVLMNTLYFKSEWQDEYFRQGTNKEDVFHAASGDVSGVTYMTAKVNSMFSKGDHWLSGELKLKGGTIRFVLPDKGTAPEDLLKGDTFLNTFKNGTWKNCELKIELPKFSYKADINLLERLKALGIEDLLCGGPDFSRMSDVDLFVSEAKQKTFVGLDEKGVEAAAFTYVGMKETAIDTPGETVELTLDRPFIYVIEDVAGSPLFVGIVRNPKAD